MAFGKHGTNRNGWGGARVGGGRKPGPVNPFKVWQPTTPADQLPEDADLLVPPKDLPEDQVRFWIEHAPLALERRTLITATVPTFRLLCELHAKKVMVGVMVDKGALGGLRVFMQLSKQVEGLMARFCLAPFGKPAKSDAPKAAANPWEKLG